MKRAVVVVVVELERGSACAGSGKVFTVDEQDVGISVVVVINECAAGTHRLRQPFLTKGAIVMDKVNAGLRGNVAEVNLCVARCRKRNEYSTPGTSKRHGEDLKENHFSGDSG